SDTSPSHGRTRGSPNRARMGASRASSTCTGVRVGGGRSRRLHRQAQLAQIAYAETFPATALYCTTVHAVAGAPLAASVDPGGPCRACRARCTLRPLRELTALEVDLEQRVVLDLGGPDAVRRDHHRGCERRSAAEREEECEVRNGVVREVRCDSSGHETGLHSS